MLPSNLPRGVFYIQVKFLFLCVLEAADRFIFRFFFISVRMRTTKEDPFSSKCFILPQLGLTKYLIADFPIYAPRPERFVRANDKKKTEMSWLAS